ncbi:hypothetical protein COLO4_13933 [Corchorus olitorius]|uniref:SAGA-associated factor 11 n=1 Tax=Corchorus olitorius TaxID=93759 RepID=A0A1R3JU34_9ROSI|nr:hypothetical protein COLO4_13933 [Corchorus olitorius]
MVCSLGSGRMAVMAGLLEAGSITPNVAEDVCNQKLAAQYIYKELRGADEANLLDEDDMNVFGLKPMADPLLLDSSSLKFLVYTLFLSHIMMPLPIQGSFRLVQVCCNACKKPIKASQYAAHAELCKSLKTTVKTILEPDGSTGHRKPPRKERKKSLAAYSSILSSHFFPLQCIWENCIPLLIHIFIVLNPLDQPTPVVEQERSEIIDADDNTATESHMDGQIGSASSSLTMDGKRNSACVDRAYVMDGSGVSLNNTDHSASLVPPSTKRFKLIVGENLPLPDDPKTACGVTKILNSHDLYASRDSPRGRVLRSETPNDRQAQKHCLLMKGSSGSAIKSDIPVPLCTKVYYSQRNNYLRSTLSQQFRVTSTEESCSDMVSAQASQQSMMRLQGSSQEVCALEQMDNLLIKKRDSSPLQNPDQVLVQSSEVCLSKSGEFLPSNDYSNQHPMDNSSRSQAASVGLTRSKYISNPYSFAGNSGKLLAPMQPPNGSVPVV